MLAERSYLPLRLTDDELVVEAGGSAETTFLVGPLPDDAEPTEVELRLRGLPPAWFDLGARRVALDPGATAEVRLVLHPPHADHLAPPGRYTFALELSDGGGRASSQGGVLQLLPPGAAAEHSTLMGYLPRAFRTEKFLDRFLGIFQSVIDPIQQRIDDRHHYLDPAVAPSSYLPWLASWVDARIDPTMDQATQREAIRRAVELYRWKGTRRALREELSLRTGGRALVVENFDGLRLGQDASMGMNTQLGARRDGCVVVTIASRRPPSGEELRRAEELIEELKPAHVGQVVRGTAIGGPEPKLREDPGPPPVSSE